MAQSSVPIVKQRTTPQPMAPCWLPTTREAALCLYEGSCTRNHVSNIVFDKDVLCLLLWDKSGRHASLAMSVDLSPLLPLPQQSPSQLLEHIRGAWRDDADAKVIETPSGSSVFGPFYGITVVSMLTESCIETFAVPLYNALSNIAEIRDNLLLLPPESYHMTLRGLEETLPSVTIGLEALDGDYAAMFAGMEHAITVEPVFEDRGFTGAVLPVDPHATSSKGAVDEVARSICAHLNIQPFAQDFHVTIGCYLTKDTEVRRRVQAVVLRESKQILSVGASCVIHLLAPRVCWYDSMKRFPPLFS